MQPPKRSRRVLQPLEAIPLESNMIEYVPPGVELLRVRVVFEWKGKEYQNTIFEEFLRNTEEVSDAHDLQPDDPD